LLKEINLVSDSSGIVTQINILNVDFVNLISEFSGSRVVRVNGGLDVGNRRCLSVLNVLYLSDLSVDLRDLGIDFRHRALQDYLKFVGFLNTVAIIYTKIFDLDIDIGDFTLNVSQ